MPFINNFLRPYAWIPIKLRSFQGATDRLSSVQQAHPLIKIMEERAADKVCIRVSPNTSIKLRARKQIFFLFTAGRE